MNRDELIKIASAALTCGKHDESVGRPMLDEFENTFNPEMVLKMLKVIQAAENYMLSDELVAYETFAKALKEME